ncbi:DNA-binding barrel domain superfamily [Sesbania bispinosa]|nr:DNA-binding barrel domain superfamily [Sesbania bispinosa]
MAISSSSKWKMSVKKSFMIEFDPSSGSAQLPGLFSRDFLNEVPNIVKLVDPVENVLQVVIEKSWKGEMTFTHGWNQLREIYGLNDGAWLKLCFMGNGDFDIEIQDRSYLNFILLQY